MSSRISGFYKMPLEERIKTLKDLGLDVPDPTFGGLPQSVAERMVENVVGIMELPMGVATNFKVNGQDVLVPMAIEETSVIAAASHAAKLARDGFDGFGIKTENPQPLMIGQIQIVNVNDIDSAKSKILDAKQELIELANGRDEKLVSLGGGAKDIVVRDVDGIEGKMVVVHLIVNVLDAMGANAVNSMSEHISSRLEELSGGKSRLRIISNLADHRIVKAELEISSEALGNDKKMDGDDVVQGILDAYYFAEADPYRAATHNKGIMNGIDAVVIATGNDFRAVEAGAHAYASSSGEYKPLTKWERTSNGVKGTLEMPLAVGCIGGITGVHPKAKFAIKTMGVKTSGELAGIMAAVGLAQNFAAMLALSTEGIQKGHMKLHATNIAMQAGVPDHLIDKVAAQMVSEKKVDQKRAEELAKQLA